MVRVCVGGGGCDSDRGSLVRLWPFLEPSLNLSLVRPPDTGQLYSPRSAPLLFQGMLCFGLASYGACWSSGVPPASSVSGSLESLAHALSFSQRAFGPFSLLVLVAPMLQSSCCSCQALSHPKAFSLICQIAFPCMLGTRRDIIPTLSIYNLC